ncbi:MAG: hypothetical protein A2Z25_23755 [Planctomycetes bacterium RBG_16_55_9]|nr:MAG: hypothetical protein A2Z25_23755 [Planctomycetes bacterium RBG_16_55_9]
MSEKLVINNFTGIKHLDLDLSKVNILIGPQATGKSICAKLLYHFKGFIFDIFTAVENQRTKREMDAAFIDEFQEYFPPQSWGKGGFSLRYTIGDSFIEISKGKTVKSKVRLSYSDFYRKELNLSRRELKKSIEKNLNGTKAWRWLIFNDVKQDLIVSAKVELGELAGYNQLFIPAGRSFFANLQSSIFSILSSNRAIDPFMTEFGKLYETMKGISEITRPNGLKGRELKNKIDAIAESILCGKHIYEKGKDFLQLQDGRRTSLTHASSGQQETLPLAVILSLFPFQEFGNQGFSIFIEEPEAHLFPNSQRGIVQLIAVVFNKSKTPLQFFITTHSPYILTAFNNLMQAGSLEKRVHSDKEKKKLHDIIPPEQVLDPNVVRAFSLADGKGKNICSEDTGLISPNVIDEVSHVISTEFGELLEME